MAILNFPNNPSGGEIYVATNGITYTFDDSTTPGVWRATTTAALAVTPGSISGNPIVGATLTYTPGVPSGGTPTYTVTQLWYVDGIATTNTTTSFNVTAAEVGKSITVVVTAQDSAVPAVSASATTAPVTILSPVTVTAGSIAAVTPRVGTPITFTPGTASGGTGSYTITYLWKADGGAVAGTPSNTTTYTPVAGDIGKVLTVVTTATDQTYPSLTANATTAPTAAVVPASIAPGVWSPSPSLNTNAESISSGSWGGSVPQTITASGCVEVSLDGSNFFPSVNLTVAGATLYQRWKPSCVGQKSGDTITGSVSAGTQGTNDYSIQLDHIPSNTYNNITSSNVVAGSVATQTTGVTLNGVNAPAYVTIAPSGNTGTNIQAATAVGGPWVTLQTTGTLFPLLTGQTLFIRQTTGSAASTGYVANIRVGDDPAVSGATFSTFTYTATTASSILPSVWTPNPDLSTDAQSVSSGLWNGTFPQVITASGCVEVSLDGNVFSNSVTVNGNVTLYQRWKPSCVGQVSGDTITGSVNAGSQGQNDYTLQLDHRPSNAYNNLTATGVALGATVVGTATSTLAGVNAPAYVTIASSGNTGTNIQASTTSATGPWTTLATTGTGFQVLAGQTLYIKQTVGNSTGIGYVANIQVGDDPAVGGAAFSSFTFTATTTSSAAFPGLSFTPASGPNAAPQTVSNVTGGGTLGTLNGVANSGSWPTGFDTSLSSPASGGNPTMKFRKNSTGSYVTSALNVVATDVLNLAWNEAYLATVTDGSNATGTITGTVSGITYTNTFTLPVKRSAVWSVPSPAVTGAALNTSQTTGARVVNDFNVPVTVTFANPTGPALPMTAGTISAIAGSNPAVSITLGTTTLTLNPGETLEVIGNTGGANDTEYGVKITVGTSAAQDWIVKTTAVPNAITAPTMAPTGGPLNPADNSPAGITLSGGTYTFTGSPGAQTSSDWQLFGNLGSTSVNPETSAIVSVSQNAATPWTQQSSGVSSPALLYYAAYGSAGGFVSVVAPQTASSWSYITSPDGVNWTPRSSSLSASKQITSVRYVNGRYISTNGGSGGTTGGIEESSTGVTWNAIGIGWTDSTASLAYDVAYGAGLYVVVGSDGIQQHTISTSPNLGAWTKRTSGLSTAVLYGITFGNNLFVTVGQNGVITTSPDGINWTPRTSGTSETLNRVAYGNGLYVAVGTNGVLITSPDGTNWTPRTSGFGTSEIRTVEYDNGLWLIGGAGAKMAASTNGITWTLLTTSFTSALNGFAYGNSTWVGIGQTRETATSAFPLGSATLTLTDNTDLSSMVVGDTVVEVGGGADASGQIAVINSGGPTITLSPSTGTWSAGVGATAKDTSRTVTTPNQPLISTNQISAVNPGSAGTSGTLAYKNAASADPNPALAQNAVYGKIAQDNALAQGAAPGTYPMFEWAATVNAASLNGFNDWYIPAKNEFEILYYNLKPDPVGTQPNNTSSGINPNAVPARASNYSAGGPPVQTTSALFQVGGAEAFTGGYRSATESSGTPSAVWEEYFNDGLQQTFTKAGSGRARVIRRIPIADYTAAGSPAIGSYLAGGFYGGQISTAGNGIADYALIVAPNIGGSYQSTPGANATLSISGANTDGFAVGNTISNGLTGGSAATGIISAITGTTVTLLGSTATNWANGQNLYRGQTIVDVANYTTPPLTSYLVPQASLATSTTYWSRARYRSATTTSPWASWASFSTSSSFAIAPGTQIGGGYFAGQIRVPAAGGTIYNLIVAPVRGDNTGPNSSGTLLGQYSTDGGSTPASIQWKTSATGPDGGASQNEEYGKTWTDAAGGTTTSGLGGQYPLFGWVKNSLTGPNGGGGIGGFTDWYIPAKNELEVLYYYFKPTNTGTDPNTIFSGSNPNAVAPEPVSTNYTTTNPAQTAASIFQGTNAQAFSTANQYWSSTEASSNTTSAWLQSFFNGNQGFNGKDGTKYARAVRRVAA